MGYWAEAVAVSGEKILQRVWDRLKIQPRAVEVGQNPTCDRQNYCVDLRVSVR